MHFTQILALASSAALVAAAPAPVIIGPDDVVLYGDNGRFAMMKRDDFDELRKLRESGTIPPKPSYLDDTLITLPANATDQDEPRLQKRGETIIIPNPRNRFLGWDVLMSSVVKHPLTVTIATGVSITNTISVGQNFGVAIGKYLTATTSIDYSYAWQTTQTQTFAAPVPEGKYGALVTNAWTNRDSGNVWQGSIGGEGSLTYYQADSFEDRSYGDLNWVNGVISLCTSDTMPVKRCLGEGEL